VGFLGKWHAQLEYLDGEADEEGGSFDDSEFDGYRLIVGAHPAINDSTQARFDLTYFDYSNDFDAGDSADQDGYGLGFGLRHAFSQKFEGTAELWYVEGSFDFDGGPSEDFNDVSLELQGRYNWTPSLSVGITYLLNGGVFGSAVSSSSSSGDVARFDVRWAFGYNGLSDIK
jgi:long-subunit fatty acid transport protein